MFAPACVVIQMTALQNKGTAGIFSTEFHLDATFISTDRILNYIHNISLVAEMSLVVQVFSRLLLV